MGNTGVRPGVPVCRSSWPTDTGSSLLCGRYVGNTGVRPGVPVCRSSWHTDTGSSLLCGRYVGNTGVKPGVPVCKSSWPNDTGSSLLCGGWEILVLDLVYLCLDVVGLLIQGLPFCVVDWKDWCETWCTCA